MTRIRSTYLALVAVLRKTTLIIAALTLTPYAANAQIITVDATDSGWYNPALGHGSSNKNYAAGPDDTYRNYFVFDLSGISGEIVSATLRLETDPNWINGTPNYEIYDVTTDISTLVADFPPGATTDAIHADLGSGIFYGSGSVDNTTTLFDFSLNAAALASINAGTGGQWALGGRNSLLDGSYAFWNTGLRPMIRQLIVEVGTVSESDEFSVVVIPDTQGYVERFPEVFKAQADWIVANQADSNIAYVAHLGDLKDDISCDTKNVRYIDPATGEFAVDPSTGAFLTKTEWDIVSETLDIIQGAGVPLGVVAGNHDFKQTATEKCIKTDLPLPMTEFLPDFNKYAGVNRFEAETYYGDSSDGTPGNRVVDDPTTMDDPATLDIVENDEASNEDNFTLFEANGIPIIAINLAYRPLQNVVRGTDSCVNFLGSDEWKTKRDAEFCWADMLLTKYSDRLAIITTHALVDENNREDNNRWNQFLEYGAQMYGRLKGHANLFMMLGAHERGEAWRIEDRSGEIVPLQPVHALLSDYQSILHPQVAVLTELGSRTLDGARSNVGDSGFMRIMRFNTATGLVNIETIAPPVPELKPHPSYGGIPSRSARPATVFLESAHTITAADQATMSASSIKKMDDSTVTNFSVCFRGYITAAPGTCP